MSRFLLYLPTLACPLLMLVCMAGMRRIGGTPAQTEAPPPASAADRIARLERELAALRAEQQHAPAHPARAGPGSLPYRPATRPAVIVTVPASTGR